jgi:hypothetical protein
LLLLSTGFPFGSRGH